MRENKSLLNHKSGHFLWVWLATIRKALRNNETRMNGGWSIPVETSLLVGFFYFLFRAYHTSWIPIEFFIELVLIHTPQWFAVGDVVACDVGTLLESKNADSSFLFSLSVLPSFRGCLKLPSLTLFTFSLFYRYREEMAWNPAVFRILDKLHSHSKWIYINKETDTLQWVESGEHNRKGRRGERDRE